MERDASNLEEFDVQYHRIKQIYLRLTLCHDLYKIATTRRDYSHIWVECTQMEQELDAIELYNIKREVQRDELHTLRRLMLTRLGQLETKAKRKYLGIWKMSSKRCQMLLHVIRAECYDWHFEDSRNNSTLLQKIIKYKYSNGLMSTGLGCTEAEA